MVHQHIRVNMFTVQDQVRLLYRALLSVPWADRTAPSRDDRPLYSIPVVNPEVGLDPVLPSSHLGRAPTGVAGLDEEEEESLRVVNAPQPTHVLIEGHNADLACCSAGPELTILHDPSALSHLCKFSISFFIWYWCFLLFLLQKFLTFTCFLGSLFQATRSSMFSVESIPPALVQVHTIISVHFFLSIFSRFFFLA